VPRGQWTIILNMIMEKQRSKAEVIMTNRCRGHRMVAAITVVTQALMH